MYKICFYNGEIPDKIKLTFVSNAFRGELRFLENGIQIDYYSFKNDNKLIGTYCADYSEITFEKKIAKCSSFLASFSAESIVIKSNQFIISIYVITSDNENSVNSLRLATGEHRSFFLTPDTFCEIEERLKLALSGGFIEYDNKEAKIEPIYTVEGAMGRYLYVYEDKCVIKTKASVGSFVTGNVSDGEKTVYYMDCIGVQFKKSGLQVGYLQLETASSTMNNKNNNFFNENSFTFNSKASDERMASNERMAEIADFVKRKVEECKRKGTTGSTIINNTVSDADELMKFKNLLDMGVITQEEFDAKKKQILGL